MKKWMRYRSLRRLVVALAAVVVAVPVAQAQAQATQQDPGLTQPAQTAKRVYGIPADSYRHLPADDQQALRPPRTVPMGGHSPSAAVGGYGPSTPGKTHPSRSSTPVVFDSSSTFSLRDASIWGAGGLVLMSFGALGGLLLARRSRLGQPAV